MTSTTTTTKFNWLSWSSNPFQLKGLHLRDCLMDGNCQFTSVANCILPVIRDKENRKSVNGDVMREFAANELKNEADKNDIKLWMESYCWEIEKNKHGQLVFGGSQYWFPKMSSDNKEMRSLLYNAIF